MRLESQWIDLGGEALDGGALPPVATPFHGRWRELAAIKESLTPGAVVVLEADSAERAGVGRTVLLRQVAHQAASAFPGGVLWWDLDLDGRRIQPALHRWGRQLKSPSPPVMTPEAMISVLTEMLSARAAPIGPTLIVIDGVDEASLAAVRPVLGMLPPNGTLLVAAEDPVVGQALGGKRIEVTPLQVVEGLGLLRVSMGRSLPQNAAVAVLKGVDLLPLGIKLAGRRNQVSPPADPTLLAELPDSLSFDDRLVARLPGNPAVAAIFYTLYAEAPPTAQRVFRWIGALRGSEISATDLAGMALTHVDEVARDLEVLGTRGLIDPSSHEESWTIHPLLRGFARTLLRAAGENTDARERHLAHFRGLATAASAEDARHQLRLIRRARELQAAAEYALVHHHEEDVLVLTDALVGSGAWQRAGYYSEAAMLLKGGLEIVRRDGDPRRAGYEAKLMEIIRHAPKAAQGNGMPLIDDAEPQSAQLDPEALESLRDEAIAESSQSALETEAFVAQARVWIDGGHHDAGNEPSDEVKVLLEGLDELGDKGERQAESATSAVVRIEQARTASAIESALAEARRYAKEAEGLASDAEEAWSDLQQALVAVDTEHARAEAVADRVRQEAEVASRVLDDAKKRIREQRKAIPGGVTGPVKEVWAKVTRSVGSATSALAAAEEAVLQLRDDEPVAAREALAKVQSSREQVESFTQAALESAMKAVRVARSFDDDGSVRDVRETASKAEEAARRFERVQRKISGLLEPDPADPGAARILSQLHELYQEVLDRVDAAVSAVDAVHTASNDTARRRLLRGAETAAREVSARALDALSLLPEAEDVSARLVEGGAPSLAAVRADLAARHQAVGTGFESLLRRAAEAREAGAQRGDRAASVVAELDDPEGAMREAFEAAKHALKQAEVARNPERAREAVRRATELVDVVEGEVRRLDQAVSRVHATLAMTPATQSAREVVDRRAAPSEGRVAWVEPPDSDESEVTMPNIPAIPRESAGLARERLKADRAAAAQARDERTAMRLEEARSGLDSFERDLARLAEVERRIRRDLDQVRSRLDDDDRATAELDEVVGALDVSGGELSALSDIVREARKDPVDQRSAVREAAGQLLGVDKKLDDARELLRAAEAGIAERRETARRGQALADQWRSLRSTADGMLRSAQAALDTTSGAIPKKALPEVGDDLDKGRALLKEGRAVLEALESAWNMAESLGAVEAIEGAVEDADQGLERIDALSREVREHVDAASEKWQGLEREREASEARRLQAAMDQAARSASEALDALDAAMRLVDAIDDPLPEEPDDVHRAYRALLSGLAAVQEAVEEANNDIGADMSPEAAEVRAEATAAAASRAHAAVHEVELRAADLESARAAWLTGVLGEALTQLDRHITEATGAEVLEGLTTITDDAEAWGDAELDQALAGFRAEDQLLGRLLVMGHATRRWIGDLTAPVAGVDIAAVATAYGAEVTRAQDERSVTAVGAVERSRALLAADRTAAISRAHGAVEEVASKLAELVGWTARAGELESDWPSAQTRATRGSLDGWQAGLEAAAHRLRPFATQLQEAGSRHAIERLAAHLEESLEEGRRIHGEAAQRLQETAAQVDEARSARLEQARAVVSCAASEVTTLVDHITVVRQRMVGEAADLDVSGPIEDALMALSAQRAGAREELAAITEAVQAVSGSSDPHGAWTTALGTASSLARVLRLALDADRVALSGADAIVARVRSQLATAREQISQAAELAEQRELTASTQLELVREVGATWRDPAVSEAVGKAEVIGRAIFDRVSLCQKAQTRTRRIASIRAAEELAAGATAAAEALLALLERLETAASEVNDAIDGAHERLVCRAEERVEEVRRHARAASAALVEELAAAEVETEAWELAPVVDALADLQQATAAIEEIDAGVGAVALKIPGSDGPGLGVILAELDGLEREVDASSQRTREQHQALQELMRELHADQASMMLEDADMVLADVDELVSTAQAAEIEATGLVSRVDNRLITEVFAALQLAVDAAVQTAEQMRHQRAELSTATEIGDLREALLELEDRHARLAEHADRTRERLEDVGNQVRLAGELKLAVGRLLAGTGGWVKQVQIRYDEAELTIEAARSDMEFAASDKVSEQWGDIVAELDTAREAISELGQALTALPVVATLDEAETELQRARNARDRAAATSASILARIPAVISTHLAHTQAAGDVLEGRMRSGMLRVRTRHLLHKVEQAYARSRRASATLAAKGLPTSWGEAVGRRERLVELSTLVSEAADAAIESTDAEEVNAFAASGQEAYDKLRAEADALMRTAVAVQSEALERDVEDRRADTDARREQNVKAADAIAWVAGIRPQVRAWQRSASRWAQAWPEEDVQASAERTDQACGMALVALDDASELARVTLHTRLAAKVTERLEAAYERLAGAEQRVEAARGELRTLAATLRGARDARLLERRHALKRQQDAKGATDRLREILGPRSAARRIPLFEKGLAVARLRGDDNTLRGWLVDLGDLYAEVARTDDASVLYDEALEIAARTDAAQAGRVLQRMGHLALARGEAQVARRRIDEGLELAHRLGDSDLEDALHADLGEALLGTDDLDGATLALEAALRIAEKAGERRLRAVHLGRLASVSRRQGEVGEALERSERAQALYEEIGDTAGIISELVRRSDLSRLRGLPLVALDLATSAVDLCRGVEEPRLHVAASAVHAAALVAAGRPRAALGAVERASRTAEAIGDRTSIGVTLSIQGSAHRGIALRRTARSPGLGWAASRDERRRYRRKAAPKTVVEADRDRARLDKAGQHFLESADEAEPGRSRALRLLHAGMCWLEAGRTEEARHALGEAHEGLVALGDPAADRAASWLARLG